MDCSLCSQRIGKDKGHDFFGDVLCNNCHARLKVGQFEVEQMQDSFMPILVPEGETREKMASLSLRAGYVGRRGFNGSAREILVVLYEKYRERKVDPGYVTSLVLTARTLALYGQDSVKGLTDSETKYLLTLCEQEAEMLEKEWAGKPEGVAMRFTVLRALLGAVLRVDPSIEELAARILAYERIERRT